MNRQGLEIKATGVPVNDGKEIRFQLSADIPVEWAGFFRSCLMSALEVFAEKAAEHCDVLADSHGDFAPNVPTKHVKPQ